MTSLRGKRIVQLALALKQQGEQVEYNNLDNNFQPQDLEISNSNLITSAITISDLDIDIVDENGSVLVTLDNVLPVEEGTEEIDLEEPNRDNPAPGTSGLQHAASKTLELNEVFTFRQYPSFASSNSCNSDPDFFAYICK